MKSTKHSSLVAAFARELRSVFTEWNVSVEAREVESLASFIARAMGSSLRDYHGPEHAFEVARGLPAAAKLAALFHDIVYVQVDSSWIEEVCQYFSPFQLAHNCKLDVQSALKGSDQKWAKLIAVVFGIENENALTVANGLNELLSCTVMVNKVAHLVPERELVRAIACIEATIPFRGMDHEGLSAADRLGARLKRASSTFILKFSKKDITETLQQCRAIVARDLVSFGATDPTVCFSQTWKAIFEGYPRLRNSPVTIREYREVLWDAYDFLSSLCPSSIFWTDSRPSSAQQKQNRQVATNLELNKQYLKLQMSGAAVLEAIAVETGGDVSIERLLGQGDKDPHFAKIKNKKPKAITPFLKVMTKQTCQCHRKTALIAAFLYHHLTAAQTNFLWAGVQNFIKGQISANKMLSQLPTPLLKALLQAMKPTAVTRARKLDRLIRLNCLRNDS